VIILKCDFCSSSAVMWRYPAESSVVFRAGNHVAESVGDWCACEECSQIIDAGEPERLAVRSAETCRLVGLGSDALLSGIKIIHQAFWLKRTGLKIPISERELKTVEVFHDLRAVAEDLAAAAMERVHLDRVWEQGTSEWIAAVMRANERLDGARKSFEEFKKRGN
jgi:hypothetical protein